MDDDTASPLQPDGRDELSEWTAMLQAVGESEGHFEELGSGHGALFSEEERRLLVTFERGKDIRARRIDQLPLAATLADETGWSRLTVITEKDDWFRSSGIFGYFDRLIDEDFFEDFDRVVFYGAGMGGYAAAAFSVAAPGATVVALNPQATLDPRVSEWDPRFRAHRRLNFTDRYGYGPDMVDAAGRAFILYDPLSLYDAMHSALYTAPHVSRLRCPLMGEWIEEDLLNTGILHDVIDAACEGKLDEMVFHRLFRARRNYPPYLRRLLKRLDQAERPYLSALLCHNVTKRLKGPRFRTRLAQLTEEFRREGRSLPWPDDPGDEG
ncbi:hypothetical protein Ga0609869_002577 [Rhodovulum iodosum]|uniref:Phosphoadenosine phosphosulfate reductase n=1 Tax=Rhodovulum iodosum TaxID=68291 RepID=A0ABV3XV68_9RHOB|nr:phosphoadenosine phosphosulfate reductase [Rhodovulum robiginosum]RSK33590.1 phosphoadenosine phosphosulfate reductase [Rhodovulum robiginosum]